jgi:hypothetical protein
LLSLVLAVAVIAGIVAALSNTRDSDSPDESVSVWDKLTSSDDDSGAGDDAAGTTSASDGTLTATDGSGSGSSKTRPKVTDKPAPPSSSPPAPGETPDTAWQQYLDETRAIVQTNAPSLADAIAAATLALSNGDAGALGSMFATDEGDQSAYIAELADRYPTILTSAPGPNVNIFTSGTATLYFGYSMVTWTDAGLTSQHTIPIMLRFADGAWVITTLGDTGSDLQFVQSVTL